MEIGNNFLIVFFWLWKIFMQNKWPAQINYPRKEWPNTTSQIDFKTDVINSTGNLLFSYFVHNIDQLKIALCLCMYCIPIPFRWKTQKREKLKEVKSDYKKYRMG